MTENITHRKAVMLDWDLEDQSNDWQELGNAANKLSVIRVKQKKGTIGGRYSAKVYGVPNIDMGAVLQLVRANMEHLEVLKLTTVTLWSPNRPPETSSWIMDEPFPNLRDLKIRALWMHEEVVSNFVSKQQNLEVIDLTLVGIMSNKLLATILKKKDTLRSVRIKTKAFESFEPKMWDQLHELKLNSFELHLYRSGRPCRNTSLTLTEMIEKMPKTARSISIKGLPATVHNRSVNLASCEKLNLERLTKLDLGKCEDLLADEDVQWIAKNLVLLEVMNLSKVGKFCTEYAFTGVRRGKGGPTGVSISNLTSKLIFVPHVITQHVSTD